jgi:hypothetical protein
MSASTDEILRDSIRILIDGLYQQAEREVSNNSRITPLGELIASSNLNLKELPDLSQQDAMEYLVEQGALSEAPRVSRHDELAGFLYTSTLYGCIFTEADDHLVRRRFSAAHELGHYLLHFRPLLTLAQRKQEYLELTEALYRSRADDPQEMASGQVATPEQLPLEKQLPPEGRMEYEANQFATELLMPAEMIHKLFARIMLRFNDDDLVSHMATEMLISQEAMRLRLRNFGLLPLPERH